MQCPNCEVPLMMTERKGIEIDFCTQCRGIWLDRGELDKIIEISTQEVASTTPNPISLQSEYQPAKSDRRRQYDRDRDRDEDYRDRDRGYKSKRHYKSKSLLHTLFDIID